MLPTTSQQPQEPQEHEEIAQPQPENRNEAGTSEEPVEIIATEEIVGEEGQIFQEHLQSDQIAVVDGEEIIFAEEDYVYDTVVSVSNERNYLFDMYQPHESEHGTFLCKICMRTGKQTEYPDRQTFVAHRYKCHGSFNNNVICPIPECREVYASLYTLRRHLSQQHDLPLEIHQQSFANIGEFEKFRHLVEVTSGCRYMMHTKQPKYRRQVMHCAKSEHKLVLQTQKHRLPRERMAKEGSACPSVISYRVNPYNGEVNTFMQLLHVGHAPDHAADVAGNANSARPLDIVFPQKPPCFAANPMQYVQIDVHEMPTAVYGNKMYECILVVTCLKSRFMWARPMLECTRTAIGRILNSIFNEFGVPEGFSTTYSPTYIRDTMKALESVYAVEIREIWSEPPPYASLEHWAIEMAEQELGTRNRWVEQMQFVVMEYNQKSIPERPETPFQRMFNRRPPNLYSNGDANVPDALASKVRRHHLELRREDGHVTSMLNTCFNPGDKVFLRKGITKPRRGNNTQFYFGVVGERDLSNQYYPYKVHFSSTDSPWPTDRNMFVWVSVFDLLPTTHEVREMALEDRQETIANLLCTCSGETTKDFDLSAFGELARKTSKCVLYRNLHCTNQMSRLCCKVEANQRCRFHELYPENDESYTKMEAAMMSFKHQNKRIIEKVSKEMENHATRGLQGEDISFGDEEDEDVDIEDDHPPILEPQAIQQIMRPAIDEEEQLEPSEPLAPAVKTPEPIECEEVDEQLLETQPIFRYEDPEEHPSKQQSSPRKSRKKKEEGDEAEPKRRKMTSEEPSASDRRTSGRRTIRPKNLDDYVE
ncbi:unnamed protein product [Caenorhabditis sp. 36 PRJEB53466]|nr:unnamed protein product [Caenorhabditis sp. 36 PRJEB53466]